MNLMDYAFLQNMIDCHDRDRKTAEGWLETKPIMSVYTDVRNMLQSELEMYAFRHFTPAIGEKYVMYVKDSGNVLDPNHASLTNWMGERFSYRITLGHSWQRSGKYGRYTLQTVYATNASGERWIGRWSRDNADAVVMRRLA